MEDLDDLDTGTEIDLWDHKLAAEMRQLADIFAEVVDRNARVADHGKILDPQGRVVRNYADTGLPALLRFDMPPGALYFTLEVNGRQIYQPLADNVAVPVGTAAPARSQPMPAVEEPIPVA
jgi:hypothetical protein